MASRRDLVAAALTVAAAAGAADTVQAQTSPMLRFSNPPGMSSPPTLSIRRSVMTSCGAWVERFSSAFAPEE